MASKNSQFSDSQLPRDPNYPRREKRRPHLAPGQHPDFPWGILSGQGGISATGASALNELTDVTITSLADGDSLVYDAVEGYWVNKPFSGQGFSWEGAWDVATTYNNYDVVSYQGSSYIATGSPAVGVDPTNANLWDPVAVSGANGTDGIDGTNGTDGESFTWRGAWTARSYPNNTVVSFQGSSYIATGSPVASTDPTFSNFWDLVAASGVPGTDGVGGGGDGTQSPLTGNLDLAGYHIVDGIEEVIFWSGAPENKVYIGGVEAFEVTETSLTAGDIIYYNGTEYVNRAYLLDDVSDVELSSAISGDALTFDGTEWVPKASMSSDLFSVHTGDSSIHFTVGSIDHTAIQNIGSNSHADIDLHIANVNNPHSVNPSQIGATTSGDFFAHTDDTTIHFTEASIDHTAIQNIGTNTHAQIDTHISDSTTHFTEGSIDHGSIGGLADDDHSQYLLADGSRSMAGNLGLGGNIITGAGAIGFDYSASNPVGITGSSIWMSDGTLYRSTQNPLTGSLVIEAPTLFYDRVNFGEPGFEQGVINYNGSDLTSQVTIHDINNYDGYSANLNLHRHSTAGNNILAFSTSNSDDESHAAVVDGQKIGRILGAGHDGTTYRPIAAIDIEVDGTVGSADTPGKISFSTSQDGTSTLVEAGYFDSAQRFNLLSDLSVDKDVYINRLSDKPGSILYINSGSANATITGSPSFTYYDEIGSLKINGFEDKLDYNGITQILTEQISVVSESQLDVPLVLRKYNSSAAIGSSMYFFRARGSASSPTAVQNGDAIGIFGYMSYDGTTNRIVAEIRGKASEDHTSTNHGSELEFKTTPLGTSAPLTRLKVLENGVLDLRGNLISNVADPVSTGDAANKQYVDRVIQTPVAYLSLTGHQSLDSVTPAIIEFNNTQLINSDYYTHSDTVDSDKLTIVEDGVYKIHGQISIESTQTAYYYGAKSEVVINGLVTGQFSYGGTMLGAAGHNTDFVPVSDMLSLTAGDYIQVQVSKTSNTAGDAVTADGGVKLFIEKLQ